MQPIMNAPTGGMDKDLDPLYLNKQKYRDARNVRPVSDAGGSTMSMETIKGTREEFDVGNVPTQDKKVELEFNKSTNVQLLFKINDKNGNIVQQGGGSADLSQIASQMDGAPNTSATQSGNIISLTFENEKEYTVTVNDYGSDTELIRNQVIQEQLSGIDETGELYLIGQHEYHDKLFLFFTTCTTSNGGTGEIGVVTENTDGTLNYLRGLRSKELKFSTQYPIEAVAEETDFRVAVYFTDNFNELRKFAYDAPVSNSDFGLVQNGGRYDLGAITRQIKLIPVNNIVNLRLKTSEGVGGQIQAGGNLKAGTYRYAVRFLTSELEETTWTTLTDQIPVFKHSLTDNPQDLKGSPSGEPTGKINVLEVSGVDTNAFDFVELAFVRYVGSTPTGSIAKRVTITGETMEISHTGNEQNQRTLGDLSQFSLAGVGIDAAKNISILDNRFFASNITFKGDILSNKLQQIASNINVTWNKLQLNGLPEEQKANAEYMTPDNCANKVGYFSGETYRFGIRYQFTNGSVSKVFHVQDTGPPLSGALTKGGNANRNNPLVNYPVFNNIDFSDPEVNREVIGYQIMRVGMDDTKREMLFSGIATPCFQVQHDTPYTNIVPEPYWPMHPDIVRQRNQGFPFSSSSDTWVINSPDIFYNAVSFDRGLSGDEVYIVYGNPYNVQNPDKNKTQSLSNQFYEYDGRNVQSYSAKVRDADLINGAAVGLNFNELTLGASLNDGGDLRDVEPVISPSPSTVALPEFPRIVKSIAVFIDKSIVAVNDVSFTNELYTLPIFFYKRPKTNKFGDTKNSIYEPCQQIQPVQSNQESTDVFSGDTFNQKSIIHQWYATGEADPQNTTANASVITSFYSQNRVNSQLRIVEQEDDIKDIYPQGGDPLAQVLQQKPMVVDDYNQAYRYQNGVQFFSAYNPNFDDVSQSETRIYFSLLNPTNSRADKYGQFKPLNYKDLDPNNGPINHMAPINGFLHTWQPRAFSRLYVNMTGLINPEDSTSIVTGSNEVLQKKEKKLSTYGTNHKWSVVIGRSEGGNDVAYWYSSEFNKMLRFGYDGTVPISDRDGMQAYFANEFSSIRGFDSPTHIGGVHGVWNERFKEMLMTFIIPRDAVDYDSETELRNAGYLTSTVSGGQTTYYLDIPTDALIKKNGKFYEPKFFIDAEHKPFLQPLLQANDPTVTPLKWNELTLESEKAFKTTTIVHSSLLDSFSAFYDHPTRIYAPINDGIISQNPKDLKIHKHDSGNYCEFYGNQHNASIKMPINDQPNIPKVYQAIAVKSQDTPLRAEFETEEHESYLVSFDFEFREGMYMAPIKLDSSLDGINDNDSENLRGHYLFTKVLFEPNKYNNLFNFVVRTVESYRNIKA